MIPDQRQITPANPIARVTALLLSDKAASETADISPEIIAKAIDDKINMQKTHFIIMQAPRKPVYYERAVHMIQQVK
jgi:hypothetical protein